MSPSPKSFHLTVRINVPKYKGNWAAKLHALVAHLAHYAEGKSAKEAWEAYKNSEISMPHHVQQRVGVLETVPTVAINACHNIDGTHACRLQSVPQ